ncbi:alpha/beta hydrolase [Phytohabitans rumicis]|uniref:alpha/beta hydrolase n=1 Tax=Phytohabitans rumicis TaxID=1076125 RepID=UPI0031EF49C9
MATRTQFGRLRRTLLAALVGAAVVVPMSGAARSESVPAPAPAALGPLRAATCASDVAARYAADRDGVGAAERMAAGHGDRRRAAALRALAATGARLLWFDGRDGGRSAEVLGDLCRADRIAVLVPGSDTSFEEYGRLRDGAVALHRELGGRSAVIAWLGYPTPSMLSLSVLTPSRAGAAAPALRAFVDEVNAARPAARISVLCHSYGSVVCARAAAGLPVSGIVLYGSPGTGFDDVAALRTTATVWAGLGARDPIGRVPHVRLRLPFVTLGFGTDPVSPRFGARTFPAGDAGHSDYLEPGSVSLANIARIVQGRSPSEGDTHA